VKNDLLPLLDRGLSTLLADLSDRRLLESTLVVVTGEFGRTPRNHGNSGRDHWGPSLRWRWPAAASREDAWWAKPDRAGGKNPMATPTDPKTSPPRLYRLLGIQFRGRVSTPPKAAR